MRKSKYLNKTFGNWTCTHVGVARKQPVFLAGTRKVSKRPHHQTYYYIFERMIDSVFGNVTDISKFNPKANWFLKKDNYKKITCANVYDFSEEYNKLSSVRIMTGSVGANYEIAYARVINNNIDT